MNNNLKHLIELQKIDSRLLDITDLRGDLPIKVEELAYQLAKAKENFIFEFIRYYYQFGLHIHYYFNFF